MSQNDNSRTASKESLESQRSNEPGFKTPDSYIRKSSTLDSELAAALQRLDTLDRTSDCKPELAATPQNIGAKLDAVSTPPKDVKDATPPTTPGGSPPSSRGSSGSPEAQKKAAEAAAAKEKPPASSQAAPANEKKDDKPAADEEDTEEKKEAKQLEAEKNRKAAHARYMRYWRSVYGGGPSSDAVPLSGSSNMCYSLYSLSTNSLAPPRMQVDSYRDQEHGGCIQVQLLVSSVSRPS